MKSLAIIGGAGRMGQAMAAGLGERGDFKITALVDVNPPRELFGAAYFSKISEIDPSTIDVVVEFANPESVVSSANWCAANKIGLVIGATGLSSEQRSVIEEAGKKTGVLIASNFSLGAVLSERFAAMAAPYDLVEQMSLMVFESTRFDFLGSWRIKKCFLADREKASLFATTPLTDPASSREWPSPQMQSVRPHAS